MPVPDAPATATPHSEPPVDRVYLAACAVFLFLLPVSTALSGIGMAVMVIVAFLAWPKFSSTLWPVVRSPIMWTALAWLAWCALTLAWSGDPGQGLDELGAARHLLVPLLLWPLLAERRLLVAALLGGVFIQNLVQFAHALGLLEAGAHGADGRTGGWLHPIQTGAFCGAALCWHLAWIVHERSRWRWLALIPALAAFAGLLLTGSRGPWLATLIAVPLELVIIIARRPGRRRFALVLAGAGVLAASVGGSIARGMIAQRLQSAADEYRGAIEREEFGTSVGLRIGLWTWAWDAFRARPVTGHGAGSFRALMIEQPAYQRAAARDPALAKEYIQRDHAHSTYLHLLACTGVIGAGLFIAFMVQALIAAWRLPLRYPLDEAVFPALILWMIVVQFDALHLNGHMFGLLCFLVALALPGAAGRPPRYDAPPPAPPPGSAPALVDSSGPDRHVRQPQRPSIIGDLP